MISNLESRRTIKIKSEIKTAVRAGDAGDAPPPPSRTTLVCDLLNAAALNGDEITLLLKSNRD